MSDQRRNGAVISLEEIFRSREFGRRPTRWDSAPVATVEATEPPQLEQVFLSELFGHPEAIAASLSSGVAPLTASTERPTLVLLPARGDVERDLTRYRGAIGAVSGVAAAALVVAGMTSGTGSRSQQPTVSAEGKPPGHATPPGGGVLPGPGGVATPPNASSPATGQPLGVTGGSAGAAPIAQVVSATTPTPATVAVAVAPPAPVEVAPAPPAPGGGTPPPAPSPGGGGSVLTPVLVTAGNTVATTGSTVTAASNDLGHVVPAASPVTGLLSNVGSTVTNLGLSVAGA